jgi:hypothetical protein
VPPTSPHALPIYIYRASRPKTDKEMSQSQVEEKEALFIAASFGCFDLHSPISDRQSRQEARKKKKKKKRRTFVVPKSLKTSHFSFFRNIFCSIFELITQRNAQNRDKQNQGEHLLVSHFFCKKRFRRGIKTTRKKNEGGNKKKPDKPSAGQKKVSDKTGIKKQ